MQWCVVHVRVGRELAAAGLLERNLQLDVFLPEVKQHWRGKMQLGPLFPGYLFVADQAGKVSEIDSTPGCGRLVRTNSHERMSAPVYVAHAFVEQLRGHVAILNETGGLPRHNLHPGDYVRILSGPLQGFDALFLGSAAPSTRVRVLLNFLGRDQEIALALDALEPCSPPPSPANAQHPPRRTRGHGRRIRAA